MRNIPVDTSSKTFVLIQVLPKLDENKNQRANANGEMQWTVQLASESIDPEVSETEKVEYTDVTISGPKPTASRFGQVELVEMVARAWEMNGRSGVSFSAKELRPAKASKSNVPTPSVNS